MKKIACYLGTRNIYPLMLPPVRSLLAYSSVDEIWLLIEDDTFPEPLPERVHVRNVSGQKYFPPDGPNYSCKWSYMVLMKAVLAKLFPDESRILCLDVDTFAVRNIDAIWETDLGGCWFAMAHDTGRNDPEYYNGGVILMDLDAIRADRVDDMLISALNGTRYLFVEQEAISRHCRGHIKRLSSDYNASDWTDYAENPAIIHYAAVRDWTKCPEYIRWAK